jgi:hypothetical protein
LIHVQQPALTQSILVAAQQPELCEDIRQETGSEQCQPAPLSSSQTLNYREKNVSPANFRDSVLFRQQLVMHMKFPCRQKLVTKIRTLEVSENNNHQNTKELPKHHFNQNSSIGGS